jgi:Fe-S cluster assembly iron-binding protein IscA
MIKRVFSILQKNAPLIVTTPAWNKMNDILLQNKKHAFLFSTRGDKYNSLNYKLEPISINNYYKIMMTNPIPITKINNNTKLVIEPLSEMLLIGTTIDYITEDYKNNIFESRFTYTQYKNKAT